MVHSIKSRLPIVAFRQLGHAHLFFLLIIQLRLSLPSQFDPFPGHSSFQFVSPFMEFHSIKYFPTLTNPRYLVAFSGLHLTLRYSRKCFLLTWPIILLVSKHPVVLPTPESVAWYVSRALSYHLIYQLLFFFSHPNFFWIPDFNLGISLISHLI